MYITKRIWAQLAVLAIVGAIAFGVMLFGYIKLPSLWFGVGQYTVTVQLPEAAGLYERANVIYNGTEVGRVKRVQLTAGGGVNAVLSLRSDVHIPANLQADVHSTSAVGEQYVALMPRSADGPTLKDGDVISLANTGVPPDINDLLAATDRGLKAIPGDNLRTVIDESYTAVGGLGPDLSRLVKGSTKLAIDAEKNLPDLLNVIDNIKPILDTQTDTSGSIRAWAAHISNVTGQLRDHDQDVRGILRDGPATVEQARQLLDRVQPTLPILAANLASVAPVLVTYRADLEQLLVLLPQGLANVQAILVPNRFTKASYKGGYLSFNLNLNLPSPCTTGFLPAQQQRAPALQDYPDRPAGDLYCRVPQDSPFNVRGARNIPCETRPGKRAPTVAMCESDENYVPLNDGLNWKGDPNATLSGQPVPQLDPGSAAPPPPAPLPVAIAQYDPATGTYVGPDGHLYTQADLASGSTSGKTWQQMLTPPAG